MVDPKKIEKIYKTFTEDLSQCIHEDVVDIDLKLLQALGLLGNIHEEDKSQDDFTQYFHVIETPEKVTLFNEQFIIWIVPKMEEEIPITYVMIALNHETTPHLEIIFTTKGIYNTPKYVLKILQHYLIDMLETEETLTAYEKNQ